MQRAEGNNRLIVYAVNSDFHRLCGVMAAWLCDGRHLELGFLLLHGESPGCAFGQFKHG